MDLSDWIRHQADSTPEKPAIIFEHQKISYLSFADQIDSYASFLTNILSVQPGDRIAYLGLNSPEFLSLIFASARIGAILLPLNWRLAGPEHVQLMQLASPVALFTEDRFVEHVDAIAEQLDGTKLIGFEQPSDDWLSVKNFQSDEHSTTLTEVISTHNDTDGILLCFTSGTTGTPKGALLSKKALTTNALNSIHMHDLTMSDTVLTVLPMFHVGGLNIQTLPAFKVGATVVLMDRFNVDEFYLAFEKYPISLTLVVPTIMHALMADPRWQQLESEHLRMISIGSSVVPENLVSTVCNWGTPLVQVYGATETSPISAYTPAADAARKPASTGKTALHCDIKLIDEKGQSVSTGAKGEILVRGDNVMTEYWNDHQATKASFTDDWFHTGDVGHFDDEGFLFVDGRIKEMIICGGENLYPAVIENLLLQHPDIEEVAVAGRPDDYWGEICVAVIVAKPGYNLHLENIESFCSDKIARSSIPRAVISVDELPRNAMGKVVKEALADLVSCSS